MIGLRTILRRAFHSSLRQTWRMRHAVSTHCLYLYTLHTHAIGYLQTLLNRPYPANFIRFCYRSSLLWFCVWRHRLKNAPNSRAGSGTYLHESPGWGWHTMGCSLNIRKPRLWIYWTGAKGRDSSLWLFSPTVLSIKPMGNDSRSFVSWPSLFASPRVLPGSLLIEFPRVVRMVSVARLQSDRILSFEWRHYLL